MSSLNLPTMPRLPSKAKFWKKRSANISEYDPTFRVIYLGNVLTGWAKGDGCVDKPLATLWKNHMSTDKPNIMMKVTVCASGLKAVTKEHGLTEYWAHRITFCQAEPSYPKVFCWIYRHEGRKMKQELRCHAVLCPSENKARLMAKRLKERLHQALIDFKKEKVWRQNARLSLANAADEQKTMPFRKIMLQAGSSNYRPPLEKGKSAPKLKVIEEVIFEEDEEEEEEMFHIKEKTDQPHQLDTNHITRLSLDGLATSESMPLLNGDDLLLKSLTSSRCSSSLSMDQLSTMTAITSFDVSEDVNSDLLLEADQNTNSSNNNNNLTVQNLIVISKDPSPDLRLRMRPRPSLLGTSSTSRTTGTTSSFKDNITNGILLANHRHNGTTTIIDSSDDSDDDDDDSDEVTDYLEKLNIEVTNIDHDINNHHNQNGDCLNDCHHHINFSVMKSSEDGSDTVKSTSAEASPRQVDSDGPASPVIITTRLASNSEQDTISDESGYSEESNPSAKDHADLDLELADALEDQIEEEEEERSCDLTVKGVLISDFSPSERLKYLQRSQSTQQRVPPPPVTHQLVPQQQQQQQIASPVPPVLSPPAVPAAAINNPMDIFQNKVPEFCINI